MVNEEVASKVAEFLLQIKSVVLQPNDPFTWTSGIKSPIYCDNRKTLSYHKIRTYIRQQFSNLITDTIGRPDVIAGVATGGIPQGTLVAQELELPFVYVRSTAKGHGLKNMVEGVIEKGQSVIVIEDLISTGKSSIAAIEALKDIGCNVKAVLAIFNYGFPETIKRFDDINCKLYTLCNFDSLIQVALEKQYINDNELVPLKEWKNKIKLEIL